MTLSYILYFVCAKPIHVGYYDHTVISSILSTLFFFFCNLFIFKNVRLFTWTRKSPREQTAVKISYFFSFLSHAQMWLIFWTREEWLCVNLCAMLSFSKDLQQGRYLYLFFLSLYNLKGTDLGTHNNWFQFISKTLLRFYCILCFGKTIFPPLHLIKHMN